MNRSTSSAGAVKTSATRSSEMMATPDGLSILSIAFSAPTGFDMSWSASTTIAKSYRPAFVGSAASRASKVTRSATPASAAFLRASAIEYSLKSNPSTVTLGYAFAMAIAAQPTPHATSATRAGFLASERRACRSGIEGRYVEPRSDNSHARLKSPCASTASVPKSSHSTPSPVRMAAITFGSAAPIGPMNRISGSMENGLSRSSSGSACS